mmetsp:Transcript_17200/g.39068  ORF Transcript_17200/g.39068 Transcript_17200/m.39068 type:complete len:289 (-) Transcript_17200:623-1489(-)
MLSCLVLALLQEVGDDQNRQQDHEQGDEDVQEASSPHRILARENEEVVKHVVVLLWSRTLSTVPRVIAASASLLQRCRLSCCFLHRPLPLHRLSSRNHVLLSSIASSSSNGFFLRLDSSFLVHKGNLLHRLLLSSSSRRFRPLALLLWRRLILKHGGGDLILEHGGGNQVASPGIETHGSRSDEEGRRAHGHNGSGIPRSGEQRRIWSAWHRAYARRRLPPSSAHGSFVLHIVSNSLLVELFGELMDFLIRQFHLLDLPVRRLRGGGRLFDLLRHHRSLQVKLLATVH